MPLISVLLAIFGFTALIGGSLIPTINGARGIAGVPSGFRTSKTQNRALADDAPPTTPGKLRVVENSGICGAFIFYMTYTIPCRIDNLGRNYAGRL